MSEDRLQEIRDELTAHFGTVKLVVDLLIEHAQLSGNHTIPVEYYTELARVAPQIAFELMIVRAGPSGQYEVLLLQRPSLEENPNEEWPEQWHCPGTTQRFDDTIDDIHTRLFRDELAATANEFVNTIAFVYMSTSQTRRRGSCAHVCIIAWADFDDELQVGQFYPLHALPEGTIEHHRVMLDELHNRLKRDQILRHD